MKAQKEMLDLSVMPPHARTELLDFYEFLCRKYGCEEIVLLPKQRKPPFSAFLADPVLVKKITEFSRDDLHERA